MKRTALVFLVISSACHAGDLQLAALEILAGQPTGPDLCFVDNNSDGVRDGVHGSSVTLTEVNAITNRADVIAAAAAHDAPAIALAAEVASLESDLTNAVNVAFGVMPPYSANVQATYRATLRTQMAQARVDLDAATDATEIKAAQKTLNQRQYIINLIRELQALKSDWALSDLP